MKKWISGLLAAGMCLALCACAPDSAVAELFPPEQSAAAQTPEAELPPAQTAEPTAQPAATEEEAMGYQTISAEEAKRMIGEAERFVILDVRTAEEFDEGHVPCAMLIPVDRLEERAPEELPDKDVPLFVYCRSGRRSAQAAGILAGMGYTAVYDFGGIIDWPYETTAEAECEAE